MSIKVLIVDDSAVVRQTLQRELSTYEGIEVVGTAIDPYNARDQIVKLKPDVLTLDIEMPRMDGLTFLKKLMKAHPMPVIMVSSVATQGSQPALEALYNGAFDVLAKPGSSYSVSDMSAALVERIRAAAQVNMQTFVARLGTSSESRKTETPPSLKKTSEKIIVIGASTGGVQALEMLLKRFPANAPPTVIVQHMPAGFTKSFAERLTTLCSVTVKEAKNGDQLESGTVLIAPGGNHTLIHRSGTQYYVEVTDGPAVKRHKPSVDVLFNSAAKAAAEKSIAVILTGMGDDGADGMMALKKAGALCAAQDEASSVVFGMPKAAIANGAAEVVLPLESIATYLIEKA